MSNFFSECPHLNGRNLANQPPFCYLNDNEVVDVLSGGMKIGVLGKVKGVPQYHLGTEPLPEGVTLISKNVLKDRRDTFK